MKKKTLILVSLLLLTGLFMISLISPSQKLLKLNINAVAQAKTEGFSCKEGEETCQQHELGQYALFCDECAYRWIKDVDGSSTCTN